MISFSLKCAAGHSFDSWFQSSSAFDKLHRSGLVVCAICGSSDISKQIMAPNVSTSHSKPESPLSTPQSPNEQALADMRRKVEETSEDVGMRFASEARAMHDGDAPERSIYGQAKPEDAKKLIDDGVPVLPLPFIPKRKTN
ncbi:DUF1178 family protein [Lentibacter algarum]|uniref:DUF1178 family protein n=1 Tax=Lentibacter algarum TaxID=576131 RepID=UPI001C070330|nr:DUF1178 family protein [Lentibacter algarum]MBU2980920.1 DUF1178 family protein [Lentibacter algarum]